MTPLAVEIPQLALPEATGQFKAPVRPTLGWLGGSLPALLAIAFISMLAFAPSLKGYFVADDLLHLAYLKKIASGDLPLLAEKMFVPWQDYQMQLLWRPLGTLTLCIDYLLWGPHPFGFHASNLASYCLTSAVLLLLFQQTLQSFGVKDWQLPSLLAAALFSSHPLHCEIVAWIVGRLDGLCALFVFSSLLLFIRSQREPQRLLRKLSWSLFALALLAKEAAISQVATLICYLLLVPDHGKPLKARGLSIVRSLLPYLLILAIFWLMRWLVLGDPIGGYIGSIGQIFKETLSERIVGLWNSGVIFYPVNQLSVESDWPFYALSALYVSCGALIILTAIGEASIVSRGGSGRLPPLNQAEAPASMAFSSSSSLNFLPGKASCAPSNLLPLYLFLLFWSVCSLAPALPALLISPTLTGSRFLYQATAPLCLLFVLVVLPQAGSWPGSSSPGRSGRLTLWAVASMVGFVAIFICLSYCQSQTYVEAGKQIESIGGSLRKILQSCPEERKVLIVNMPRSYKGVHTFYSSDELRSLTRPPLAPADWSDRVVAMEGRSCLSRDLLDKSRLARLRATGTVLPYLWDCRSLQLVSLASWKLPPQHNAAWGAHQAAGNSELEAIENAAGAARMRLTEKLSPSLIDFIDVEVTVQKRGHTWLPSPDAGQLCLSWLAPGSPVALRRREGPAYSLLAGYLADGKPHMYRFHVGEMWSWYLQPELPQLALSVVNSEHQLDVTSLRTGLRLENAPRLEPIAGQFREDEDGILHPLHDSKQLGFFYDAENVAGAQRLILEVSEPQHVFHHYSGALHDPYFSPAGKLYRHLNDIRGSITIPVAWLGKPGRYQVRLIVLGTRGTLEGCISEPLAFELRPSTYGSIAERLPVFNQAVRQLADLLKPRP